MMKATISSNEINVEHSIRPDVNREFLTISVDGWNEVKKLTKKILLFDGKKFAFTGWCSDTNKCFFAKPINGQPLTATIQNA